MPVICDSEVCCSLFVLSDYYLPKDEVEFYQFCYVDSSGQVRGASTPFSFRSQEEQSLECSPDDELLVITTQVPKADGRFGVKASDCDSEIKCLIDFLCVVLDPGASGSECT